MASRKKKRRIRFVFFVSLAALAILAGYIGYQWWLYGKARFVRYAEFGISIPEEYPIHGIDVSRYQQLIAWDAVKAMQVKKIRLGFVFIKATEGIVNTDPQFRRNWKRSKDAGMIRGAYHFFLPTKDGRMQAENFIKAVDLKTGDLPPVLDIEQTYGVSRDVIKNEVKEWLDIVGANYNVKPIIYTNIDFYKQNLGSDFDDYPLWVAHYYQPRQPRIKRDWLFWQHNDNGRVNGVSSPVDFDVFSGDSAMFSQLLIK
ncbi:MAG: glycoside hydrolase family 25 protein [Bacteroidetes bacterium]|nr:MAG: glycoside hydrolase family 25 protein [Bacteroidota bacterium]